MSEAESVYAIINRLATLIEQRDLMYQAYAQAEMQRAILYRVPDSKTQPGILKQLADQTVTAETHQDALDRTKKSRDWNLLYLRRVIRATLNPAPLVYPTDSILGPTMKRETLAVVKE